MKQEARALGSLTYGSVDCVRYGMKKSVNTFAGDGRHDEWFDADGPEPFNHGLNRAEVEFGHRNDLGAGGEVGIVSRQLGTEDSELLDAIDVLER